MHNIYTEERKIIVASILLIVRTAGVKQFNNKLTQ